MNLGLFVLTRATTESQPTMFETFGIKNPELCSLINKTRSFFV